MRTEQCTSLGGPGKQSTMDHLPVHVMLCMHYWLIWCGVVGEALAQVFYWIVWIVDCSLKSLLTQHPCSHNRLYKASKEVILYSGIAHAVMAAWGLLLRASAGSQPIVACAVIGAGANIYKLQQIFPPGPSGSSSENSGGYMSASPCAVQYCFAGSLLHCKAPPAFLLLPEVCWLKPVWVTNLLDGAALKNLLRGAALATLATFLGCFLIFTVPDFLAAQLNRQMPYWFYESEVSQAMHDAAFSPLRLVMKHAVRVAK